MASPNLQSGTSKYIQDKTNWNSDDPITNIKNRKAPDSPFTTVTGGATVFDPSKKLWEQGFVTTTPKTTTTDLGQGITAAQTAAQEVSKSAPQGTYTAAPKSVSPQESAAYMSKLAASLGIKGPADTRDATRTAAFGQLDRGAYMDALRSAGQLSAQGQERGSRSQALATLRGTELAGSKAQTEAQIQGQYAGQLADYQRALMSGAQRQGEFQSTMGAQEANRATQASENNARMAQAQQQMRSATQMQAAGMMSDEEYRRKMAEYEAAMGQLQQANTADMMQLQKDAADQQAMLQAFGIFADTASSLGTKAMGGV